MVISTLSLVLITLTPSIIIGFFHLYSKPLIALAIFSTAILTSSKVAKDLLFITFPASIASSSALMLSFVFPFVSIFSAFSGSPSMKRILCLHLDFCQRQIYLIPLRSLELLLR